jgi:DNA-binding transcriptional LysR family regulator
MLDPRRLATLQAVVRAGSFAGAAEQLSYTPAAVSQHIAELERAIGLRLLERGPVRPTAAGQLALAADEAASRALAAAEAGLRALRDGEAGHLRIASFSSAASTLVTPALAKFARLPRRGDDADGGRAR